MEIWGTFGAILGSSWSHCRIILGLLSFYRLRLCRRPRSKQEGQRLPTGASRGSQMESWDPRESQKVPTGCQEGLPGSREGLKGIPIGCESVRREAKGPKRVPSGSQKDPSGWFGGPRGVFLGRNVIQNGRKTGCAEK